MGAPMPTWIAWGIRPRRSRSRLGDPFAVLEVQLSLARLEREIEGLRRTRSHHFAEAHHLRAALIAYDHLLMQACRLAGVEHEIGADRARTAIPGVDRDDEPGGEVSRVLAIAALDARGWRW